MFLGVDIGTSSSKGVLVAPDGTVVATAVREHRTATPRPGWFEHDALAIWWADFASIVAELARPDIAAVGISGIGPCVLACAEDGTPLRPAILYGVDTRATAEIAAQTERYGEAAILDRCGSPLTSQAAGPKLEWLRVNEPEVWARTRRMFMAHSWLVHRLTGAYVLDHHSASQCTPLYDTRTHEWITDWEVVPELELPALAWSGEVAGTITADAAARTGLPAGIPVVAGTIDAWAEALSVGVDAPGDVMLMYGTTMFLVEVLASRAVSPQLWGTVGVTPGTYNLAAGMATSGAITAWLRDLTGASFEALTAEADTAGRGAEGLLMLPYFAGERTPLFDPDARGTVIGLTLRHGRGHLYRAALEATAFGVRHNMEAMRSAGGSAGGSAGRLVAVGGGTRGGLWTRIVSDVLQQPQMLPAHTVGAAYGDAMLAARASGVPSDGWNPLASLVEPDPKAAADYDRLYALYRDLYHSTSHLAHALA
ncbi:FGGY-family carbohydrate kinase [Nonomuraea sp. K274]|uniref:FGGY-family carbohydrate kinase n=1 Tax=Nonomuraea cypriaca TaxID=1187855 RepID=A0A931F5X1_9ACTN|nr:FGGY-family carbohydrate kinase [Nonomuraea cypriaca]MBF8192531.1 FGGY-family carbohydrate kinase [Nonomuraea cypriaca]